MAKLEGYFTSAIATASFLIGHSYPDEKVALFCKVVGGLATGRYLVSTYPPMEVIRATQIQHRKRSNELQTMKEKALRELEAQREEILSKLDADKSKLIEENQQTIKVVQQQKQHAEQEYQRIIAEANKYQEEKKAEISAQVEDLNAQVQARTEQTAEFFAQEAEKYEQHIAMLESQVAELRLHIQGLESPVKADETKRSGRIANMLIELLQRHQVVADFENSWIDGRYCLVRTIPRDFSQPITDKILKAIHGELKLDEKPSTRIIEGTLEFTLRIDSLSTLAIDEIPRHKEVIEPELVEGVSHMKLPGTQVITEPRSNFTPPEGNFTPPLRKEPRFLPEVKPDLPEGLKYYTEEYFYDFVEPVNQLHPHGEVSPNERDWVIYLRKYVEFMYQTPTRQTKHKRGMALTNIALRVYGAKSGGGSKFRNSMARIKYILSEAKVESFDK